MRDTTGISPAIDDDALLWIDETGVTHLCDEPTGRQLLTLCELDVPAAAAHTAQPSEEVTCPSCRVLSAR